MEATRATATREPSVAIAERDEALGIVLLARAHAAQIRGHIAHHSLLRFHKIVSRAMEEGDLEARAADRPHAHDCEI